MRSISIDFSAEGMMQAIAEAFGANYDDNEFNTIYMGTDPKAGFLIEQDDGGNGGIKISLYDDQNTYLTVSGMELFYETSGSCCVFGGRYSNSGSDMTYRP